MPAIALPLIIGTGIKAATDLAANHAQSSAAKKAVAAQSAATDQAQSMLKQQYDAAQARVAPFANGQTTLGQMMAMRNMPSTVAQNQLPPSFPGSPWGPQGPQAPGPGGGMPPPGMPPQGPPPQFQPRPQMAPPMPQQAMPPQQPYQTMGQIMLPQRQFQG